MLKRQEAFLEYHKVVVDESFDEYELAKNLPSQRVLCMILSYAYSYHVAVAKFQQFSKSALN